MIRKAVFDDIPQIMAIDKEWYKEQIAWNFKPLTKKKFENNIKKNIFLVAEINNKIIGYFLATREKSKQNRHEIKKGQRYLDIYSIFILKEYRNKKIGSEFMKEFFKTAKKEGYKKIKVTASSTNIFSLIKFYQNHGFKPLFTILIKKL